MLQAFRDPRDTKLLSMGIDRLRQPIRVEEKDVPWSQLDCLRLNRQPFDQSDCCAGRIQKFNRLLYRGVLRPKQDWRIVASVTELQLTIPVDLAKEKAEKRGQIDVAAVQVVDLADHLQG